MRRAGTRSCLVAVVAMVATVAACGDPVTPTAATPQAPASAGRVPLASTLATSAGGVAVVAMGRLSDPANTFWQLFVLPNGAAKWTLATPPGVADNGGLVVSPGPVTGVPLLAGVEPFRALVLSPLARSVDDGRSWLASPGFVPGGLAQVPDALDQGTGGPTVALVRSRGGEVLLGTGALSHWSTLVSRTAMASSAAGRSCGVGALTAVTLGAEGATLVGMSCSSPGVVGIAGRRGGRWALTGPRLSGRNTAAPTKVLRLLGDDGAVSGLVAVGRTGTTSLVGVARTAAGSWSQSAPLLVGPGSHLASTGVTSGGGFVVLLSGPHGTMTLSLETGPGGSWRSLPAPPPATAVVAVGGGGDIDALSVASTRLTQWRLDGATGTWSKIGVVNVPIEFGSSS